MSDQEGGNGDRTESLRSLFDSPELARSIEGTDQVTPLQVVDEANRLGSPLGDVLVAIFRSGGATVADLAESTDIDAERVGRHLTELRLQGYVDKRREGGDVRYHVSSSWEVDDFPSGPVIPLVYQYNLLSDRSRLSALREAIDAVVKPGDVVADLGAGVGVLSYLAARHAEKVYAVEIDTDVYEGGKDVMYENGVENVEYILGDARGVELPEPVDVVLCEMLDTALLAELQVQVTNHAVDELLAEGGTVVPSEAVTSVSLVESPYEFEGATFKLPHFEAYGSEESTVLSEAVPYHEVRFDEENALEVHETVTVTATTEGMVNGIQLTTDTRFAEPLEYTTGSEWLNPPLTLPTEESFEVTPGDRLSVTVDYRVGDGLNNISYTVRWAEETDEDDDARGTADADPE